MRLITHNMLASNVKVCPQCRGRLQQRLAAAYASHRFLAQGVKNGFPLKLEATAVETREAEFNPGAAGTAAVLF